MPVSFLVMDGKRDLAYEALRRFVIERRTAMGLSQRDLAKVAGISFGVIAKMESGPVPIIPRQSSLEGLAKGLQVPYETLDRMARGLPAQAESTELSPELEAALADVATWPIQDQERFLAVLRAMRPAKQ